jgi:hypothetical protein
MEVTYSFEELVTLYPIIQRKLSSYVLIILPSTSLSLQYSVHVLFSSHKFLHIFYFVTIFYMSRPTHPFRAYVLKILYENWND